MCTTSKSPNRPHFVSPVVLEEHEKIVLKIVGVPVSHRKYVFVSTRRNPPLLAKV